MLNPTANGGNGAIVTTLAAVSGSDELWYDATNHNFYVTGVDAAGDRVIDIYADGSYSLLQSVDLTTLGADHVNAHSVAVDPFTGDIYVPLEGTTTTASGTLTNSLCPLGCVAVFGIPEPGSLPVLVVGLAGLIGLGVRRGMR